MKEFLDRLGINSPKKIEKVPVSNIEESKKPIPIDTGKTDKDWQKEIGEAFDNKNETSLEQSEINFLNITLKNLNSDLEDVVITENYEEAAILRDKINEIKAKLNNG